MNKLQKDAKSDEVMKYVTLFDLYIIIVSLLR